MIPVIIIVESQYTNLILFAHVVNGTLCGFHSQVKDGKSVTRIIIHGTRMVYYHYDGGRGYLRHASELHIHRKDLLDRCIVISSKHEAVFTAGHDKTASVVLYICIKELHKFLGKLGVICIFQNNYSVLQDLIKS